MPTLHVRSVPEELYKRLQQLAEKEKRSLTAEVIALLEAAVRERKARERTSKTLERIRHRAQRTKLPEDWVEAAELVREDRRR